MRRWLGLLLFALLLAGCDRQAMFDRYASRDEQAQAIRVSEAIRDGRLAEVEVATAPASRGDVAMAIMQWQTQSPVRGPTVIDGVWTHARSDGGRFRTFRLHSGGEGGRWARFELTFRVDDAPSPVLIALRMRVTRVDPAAWFNPFAWGAIGLLWLGLVAGTLGLSLWAAVTCWRDRTLRWRRLWAFGSLLGIGIVSLDWGTGQVVVAPFHMRLPPITVTTGSYGESWRIGILLPVVALVVLARWLGGRHGGPAPAIASDGGVP